ncbi:hypothetical protein SASPL_122535 [Salvia splendens]|uniref:Uncharacterized protein n=1 Tax=Salvia splendens TaxID=180675 RepID=A0A8X8XK48_SALSN|nr:hypothetical protein SASPL_122535 [Salvia splendens]
MSSSQVSMKLLIDTKGKRVLFAEAGKDCVDFLFHILSLPLATIIRLLKAQDQMAGSLPNLYQSLESLNDAYILPHQKKDTYLKPEFYRCRNCVNSKYISDDPRATCPSCNHLISTTVTYVAPPAGLVEGVVTYMITDDLMIMPTSTSSCFAVLGSQDLRDVEDKDVTLGFDEAVKLIKASMQSKKVLTDVFF